MVIIFLFYFLLFASLIYYQWYTNVIHFYNIKFNIMTNIKDTLTKYKFIITFFIFKLNFHYQKKK